RNHLFHLYFVRPTIFLAHRTDHQDVAIVQGGCSLRRLVEADVLLRVGGLGTPPRTAAEESQAHQNHRNGHHDPCAPCPLWLGLLSGRGAALAHDGSGNQHQAYGQEKKKEAEKPAKESVHRQRLPRKRRNRYGEFSLTLRAVGLNAHLQSAKLHQPQIPDEHFSIVLPPL